MVKSMEEHMTELRTVDDDIQLVLEVFKARRLQAGEAILVNSASQALARPADVASGLRAGLERGLFRHGANGFTVLTEIGFAEL